MEKSIEVMNNYISRHNQFTDESDLWKEIRKVLDCSEKQAKNNATTHCNSFSFYCCLVAKGYIVMSYTDFFSWAIKYKAIDEHGFISWDKQRILDVLCHKVKVIDYAPDAALHNGIYQVRIQNNHGSHFMFAYFKDNEGLYISDTGKRGIGVLADSHFYSDDKIIKFKEFVQEK